MSSLLASKLDACRRSVPITRFTRQWRRSSMHFWHALLQAEPTGLHHFIHHEDLAVPDIGSQEIWLWLGDKLMGNFPVKEVISDFLGPGTMLCLRGEPPNKKSRVLKNYEYEVRHLEARNIIREARPLPPKRAAKSVKLDAFATPSTLQNIMEKAYRILHPDNAAKNAPLEFHLKAHPLPDLTGFSLFTWGRVDLHPAVVQAALPEGSFQIISPKADFRAGKAFWDVAPEGFKSHKAPFPGDPPEMARMAEEMALKKKEWVKGLIDAGDITPKGELTAQGRLLRQKFWLNEEILKARATGSDEAEQKPEISDDGQS